MEDKSRNLSEGALVISIMSVCAILGFLLAAAVASWTSKGIAIYLYFACISGLVYYITSRFRRREETLNQLLKADTDDETLKELDEQIREATRDLAEEFQDLKRMGAELAIV